MFVLCPILLRRPSRAVRLRLAAMGTSSLCMAPHSFTYLEPEHHFLKIFQYDFANPYLIAPFIQHQEVDERLLIPSEHPFMIAH